MTSVLRFRSIWGVDAGVNYENWDKWFPSLKAQGYTGVEIDIAPFEDLVSIRRLCDEIGLEISVLIHTLWPMYAGPKPAGLTPKDHLAGYRTQLERAKTLKPYKINAHSGDDQWSVDEAVEFFEGSLVVDAEVGLQGKVCHETHRNRAFFSPYTTAKVLKRVPSLRVTADFSHFVVVCERLLDQGEEDKELLHTIIPHVSHQKLRDEADIWKADYFKVNHIHARMGTTQSSQCPEPTNPIFKDERRFFEDSWKQIIEAFATGTFKSEPITFVPEYGPFPYHPFGAASDFSDVADREASRLHPLFEEWAKAAVARS
ncbi:sugar phosphate isomerase/epimerase family protein [Aspergillus melleus]|uniref:sugar phosphate isomerase/epimerase family protein n=1 Tax=Aspergillus melleus TaxID=138277 RepID=UPI001E8CA71B|nr:uncharacterized protein LDX57_010474 [Aspergillus melleus]KAH8432844.1 hypothetical protein LDX57_010474 [Aspergillus melleus]